MKLEGTMKYGNVSSNKKNQPFYWGLFVTSLILITLIFVDIYSIFVALIVIPLISTFIEF